MAKFSSIIKGTRATRQQELPQPIGASENAEPIKALVRALNGVEEAAALTSARADAVRAKVEKPGPGEPEYDLALMVHTIALAYMDPDDDETPIFDGGPDQVREHYGREAIAYLYEVQQAWQDDCAPTVAKLDPVSWITAVTVLGGPDEAEARSFFSKSRPGLQWSFVRSLALLHVSSATPSSPSGSSSADGGASEKKSTEPQPAN